MIPFAIFVPTQMTDRRGDLLCLNGVCSNQGATKLPQGMHFFSFLQAKIVSSSYCDILASSSKSRVLRIELIHITLEGYFASV